MVIGHLAAGVIVSQIPGYLGFELNLYQQLAIVIAGYLNDFDLPLAGIIYKTPANHHFLPTHTPLVSLLIVILIGIIFHRFLPVVVVVSMGISMLVHLMLDDVSYWMYRWGWEKEKTYPQIMWLWPWKKFPNNLKPHKFGMKKALEIYYTKAKMTLILELGLCLVALAMWNR